MRFRYFAALVAVALLVALPAVAQEQRASIEGVVKDSQGGALVGATVVARMASAMEQRGERVYGPGIEVVTDSTGLYRFASLLPGRYELAANLSGFAPATVQNIDLRLGQQLNINLTLQPGGVAETVQVVAESPLIAITQSARATSLRDDDIAKMPKGRDFSSLVTQAPGANNETKLGGISIDGSSGSENRYIIDGAENTNIVNGTQGQGLVTDFVDEVQVKSSGYSAEYGGATGGVVNVITKSGTNVWRGDALFYLESDAFDGGRRPNLRLSPADDRKAEYVTYPEDSYNRFEPGFNLSGPLVRDKVWFFAGYIPVFRDIDRTVTFLSNNQTQTLTEKYRRHYFSSNITAQLGPQWRFKAAYNLSRSRYDGDLPALDGTGNPNANYAVNDVYPTYSVSGTLDYTPSNKVYMSLRTGYASNNYFTENVYDKDRVIYYGSSVGVPGVPAEWQKSNGYQNTPTNYVTTRDHMKRLNVQFDTTFFFSGGGQHQVKTGVQLDRIGYDLLGGEAGNLVRVRWNQALAGARGQYGYYQVRSNGVLPQSGYIEQGDLWVNNVGLFLQDSWTIGSRFTLNLGLRTENEHVPTFSDDPSVPQYGVEWGFGDKLAPRVGFAWDVTGTGKTKAFGSWGIFYDIMKLELPVGSFGGAKWLEYYYSLDSGDLSGIVDNQNCPPACPGTLLRGPIDFRHVSLSSDYIEPDLKPMKMQEAAAGIEHEFAPNLSISGRYVRKWVNTAIEDAGALDAQGNEIYIISNPGFGLVSIAYILPNGQEIAYPKAKRNYDGVEVALNKRMSNNWMGRVSYLWSRLWGNYSGLSQSDENGRTSPNVGRNFDYPAMAFDENGQPVYGVLATDRTHQVKAQFIYDFDFGLTAGLNWYGSSGVPRTREMGIYPPNNLPVNYLGRNSDGRLPFYNQLDLYAQYRINLGGNKAITLSANVFNLLNQKTATNYYATEQYGSGINIDEDLLYAGQQASFQTLAQQQGMVTDARFLMDNAYQEPITARLGVKFSF